MVGMSLAGDCVLTKLHPSGRLRIDQADQLIMIAAELLEELRRHGEGATGVSLAGDILRIEGVNRTIIYRIGDKVIDRHAYYAEWPD